MLFPGGENGISPAEIMFERVTKIRNIGGMVLPEINSILKIFKKLRSSFIVAIVRPLDGQ